MSAIATGWVWEHSPYKHTSKAALLVHLAIADVVNDAHDNEFFMSTYNLTTKLGSCVSRNTVETTLRDMVARGLLEIIESGGAQRKPTRYRFVRTTSQAIGLASQMSGPSLAKSLGANLKKNSIDELKGTSQAIGLDDSACDWCNDTGTVANPKTGETKPCPQCARCAVTSSSAS